MEGRGTPQARHADISRRHRVSVLGGAAVIGVAALAVGFSQVRAQADPPAGNNYVAIGDSISSGEGAPPYAAGGCDRSSGSWTNYVATSLATNYGPGFGYTDNACSGATSQQVISQGQLNSLTPNTQLVTITAGGNDMQFGPSLQSCVSGGSCAGLTPPQSLWDSTRANLQTLYQQAAATAPNARIVVAHYPDEWPANNQPCALGSFPNGGSTGYLSSADIISLHADVAAMNATIDQAAAAVPGITVVDMNTSYVDGSSLWAGHDICSGNASEFNAIVSPLSASFHPNVNGYNTMGWQLMAFIWKNNWTFGAPIGGGGGAPNPGPNPGPPAPGPPAPEPSGTASSSISYGPPGG